MTTISCPAPAPDELAPARGILFGLLFALPFWAGVTGIIVAVVAA